MNFVFLSELCVSLRALCGKENENPIDA